MVSVAAGVAVVPGERLGELSEASAGVGCYTAAGVVYASVLGTLQRVPDEESEGGEKLEVVSRARAAALVPTPTSIVIGKVLSINSKQAKVHILTVDGSPCIQPFPAVIRSQDVRSTNLDTVKIAESFRPGDLVRACVISLGDQRSYFLSTARRDLGVVHATVGGEQLAVVDGDNLISPTTRETKRRKVALTEA
mmetsp:Transcript_30855/g.73314  ORF Transcript_30855/g.73314 Transcript_30855/m.73314 type:complete len:194 (+) Transcript_30855:212-793(+)